MEKVKAREVVYYNEMHTMMYQQVTVLINENLLKVMLKEELTDETKRELIQTYYVCRLDQDIEIKEKTYYGAWNSTIGNIKNIYTYEEEILEKIKGQVSNEDLEKQFKLINERILGLSEEEAFNSIQIQKDFYKKLNLRNKSFKI